MLLIYILYIYKVYNVCHGATAYHTVFVAYHTLLAEMHE